MLTVDEARSCWRSAAGQKDYLGRTTRSLRLLSANPDERSLYWRLSARENVLGSAKPSAKAISVIDLSRNCGSAS